MDCLILRTFGSGQVVIDISVHKKLLEVTGQGVVFSIESSFPLVPRRIIDERSYVTILKKENQGIFI